VRSDVFAKIFPLSSGNQRVKGPMIAADHLANLMGKRVIDVCRDGEILAEGILKSQRLYGSDFVIVFADVSVEAEALGLKLQYYDHANPSSVQHLKPGDIHPVDITTSGRVPEILLAAGRCRKNLGPHFPIFYSMKDPFSLAGLVIGPEIFLEMLISQPDDAIELIQICTLMQKQLLVKAIEESYIPLIGAPLASGSLIGQNYFSKFVKPFLLELYAEVDRMNSARCLHLCGRTDQLTDEILGLKLDLFSFEYFDPEYWARNDHTIAMGFVPTEHFLDRNSNKLAASIRSCQAVLPEPYVLSSACDLPAKADPELVKVMMNV